MHIPRGSLLELLMFDIFIIDIFHSIEKSALLKHADDNSMSHHHRPCEVSCLVDSMTAINCSVVME